MLFLVVYCDMSHGLADVVIDDRIRIDICTDIKVIFTSYREGPELYRHHGMFADGVPIVTHNKGETIQYAYTENELFDVEMEFWKQQEQFIDAYVNIAMTTGTNVEFKYVCSFTPFKCTVEQRIGNDILITYTDSGMEINRQEEYRPQHKESIFTVSDEELSKFARGTGLELLKKQSIELKTRWTKMCKQALTQDDPQNNRFSLSAMPHIKVILCTFESLVPLQYELTLHGTKMIANYMNWKGTYVHMQATYTDIDFNSNIICQIRSPSGWIANISYTDAPKNRPGMIVSDSESKFQKDIDVHWHKDDVRVDFEVLDSDIISIYTAFIAAAIILMGIILLKFKLCSKTHTERWYTRL